MADELTPPLPDPVLRFRVRSLLWLTTGVAVLTAIAAPFYRRQTAVAQNSLLVCWFLMALFSGLGLWRARRNLWQRSLAAGPTDFIFWSAPRWSWGVLTPKTGRIVGGSLWIALMAANSFGLAKKAELQSRNWDWWPSVIFAGCMYGLIMAGGLMNFLPAPLCFCGKGIATARQVIRWHYIRWAKWIRPGVVRLHRFDGDLYASVPRESRDAFEAYLREKTNFVGEELGAAEFAPDG